MKLSQIGEFGLIDMIKKSEPMRKDTVIGIGDDAAAIQLQNSNIKHQNKSKAQKAKNQKYLLITTDAMIENVHFKRKGLSFFKLGQKAMLANISDISAMGGIPTHAVITAGLPRDLNLKSIRELYRGIDSLARKNNIDIVGGDTVSSPKEIVISITLLGEVEKDLILTRSGAKTGDLICVTGKFGGPAANKYDPRCSLLVTRNKEARQIAKSKLATSMIDSSDGLVRSILEICKSSKVGAQIEEELVPIATGATLEHALYGGEEYELVFTVDPKNLKNIPKSLKKLVSIAGEIKAKSFGVKLIDADGKISTPKGGYEHFKR